MYIILRGLKDNLKIKFLILLKTCWIVCYVEDVYPCVQKNSFPFNFDKETLLLKSSSLALRAKPWYMWL